MNFWKISLSLYRIIPSEISLLLEELNDFKDLTRAKISYIKSNDNEHTKRGEIEIETQRWVKFKLSFFLLFLNFNLIYELYFFLFSIFNPFIIYFDIIELIWAIIKISLNWMQHIFNILINKQMSDIYNICIISI